MRDICEQNSLRVSSLSAHSPLMKPEAAVPRLTDIASFLIRFKRWMDDERRTKLCFIL